MDSVKKQNISSSKKSQIPVPPTDIQEQIISEVDKLDEQYQNSRMKIEDYRKQIIKIFESLDILGGGDI